MLCQKCGKHPATTHFKRTVNGETTELHLCASCAAEQGFQSVFNGFGGLNLDSFWGNLFAEPSVKSVADTVRCEGCGKSFSEIAQSGRAGCPTCYTTFYDRLLPSIRRIHGKSVHAGKVPSQAGESTRRERELESLRQQLSAAINKQEYEKCAELRDRIRALENDENGKEQA